MTRSPNEVSASTPHRVMPRRWRSFTLVSVAVTLAGLLWLPVPAQATPVEVFFSEYVEGSNGNRALEIYNGTSLPVNLRAEGYNVRIHTDMETTPTIALMGTVDPGDVYVLVSTHASPELQALADQLSDRMVFNGDDAVLLRRGDGLLLDSIGQVGFDPGAEWGSGLTSTADNTLRRQPWVESGDTDHSDPFDPALEWEGFEVNTFDGLGWHSLGCTDVTPPSLSVTPSPRSLWPPNHKYVTVQVKLAAYDDTDGDPEVAFLSVTSNEPDDGADDGSTVDDVVFVADTTFKLRAERSGSGSGRVYTMTYRATDDCGNETVSFGTVVVPLRLLRLPL